MTVVELLTRLAEEGVELVRWDVAGPVWTRRPPEGALPYIAELWPELKAAWVAAQTGHAWGQCDQCQRTAVARWTGVGSRCWMTPYCKGRLTTWARCPEAVRWWASQRSQTVSDDPVYVERRARAAAEEAERKARAKDRRQTKVLAATLIASFWGWLYSDSTDQPAEV